VRGFPAPANRKLAAGAGGHRCNAKAAPFPHRAVRHEGDGRRYLSLLTLFSRDLTARQRLDGLGEILDRRRGVALPCVVFRLAGLRFRPPGVRAHELPLMKPQICRFLRAPVICVLIRAFRRVR
jgi:hypothetical protein